MLPVKETIPPNDDPYKLKKITRKKMKKIELSIGYFVEDEGFLDLLKTKSNGWYTNGSDKLFSGKYKGQYLIKLQNLVCTNIQIH
jgi:hypothetical protein